MAKGNPHPKRHPATEFKKGQSGNPGGRPKFAEISKAMRHILTLSSEELAVFVPDTYAEKIAMSQIKQSVKNKPSAEFVANRTEGLPVATVKNSVNLTGAKVSIDIMQPKGDGGS